MVTDKVTRKIFQFLFRSFYTSMIVDIENIRVNKNVKHYLNCTIQRF